MTKFWNMQLIQVVPYGGQICNLCKWHHLVAKFATNESGAILLFNQSYGVNFWVRCASGNVSFFPMLSTQCCSWPLAQRSKVKMGSNQTKPETIPSQLEKYMWKYYLKGFISNFHNQGRGQYWCLDIIYCNICPILQRYCSDLLHKISAQYLQNIGYFPNIVQILLWSFTKNIVHGWLWVL